MTECTLYSLLVVDIKHLEIPTPDELEGTYSKCEFRSHLAVGLSAKWSSSWRDKLRNMHRRGSRNFRQAFRVMLRFMPTIRVDNQDGDDKN